MLLVCLRTTLALRAVNASTVKPCQFVFLLGLAGRHDFALARGGTGRRGACAACGLTRARSCQSARRRGARRAILGLAAHAVLGIRHRATRSAISSPRAGLVASALGFATSATSCVSTDFSPALVRPVSFAVQRSAPDLRASRDRGRRVGRLRERCAVSGHVGGRASHCRDLSSALARPLVLGAITSRFS
jgi:hypothetical protein